MEADKITALKKTLKKWEAAFYLTHEKKPTREDIESAPQRIQDAYREYKDLRKSGGEGSSENKKEGSTATPESQSSGAWGSHLNKSNTPKEDDTGKNSGQNKGSLLSKLSQKLYQNYSHSKKTPRRSGKAATSSEHVLQETATENGQPGKKKEESDELPFTSIFSSSSKFKHKAELKVTTTSKKLHSQKLDSGPVCSNILMKSQERKHSLKTDWLEKCKPEMGTSVKSRNRSETPKIHNDSDIHDHDLDKSLEKKHGISETSFGENDRNRAIQKETGVVSEDFNSTEASSTKTKTSLSKTEMFHQTHSHVASKQVAVEQQFSAPCEQRTYSNSQDNIPVSVASKEPRSKRKRSEDSAPSSKRMKQSEDMDDGNKESNVPQLSSFEAFAFPDEDNDHPEQSSGPSRKSKDSEEDEEEGPKPKVKKLKKVASSIGSARSASSSAGGSSSAPSRNLNENYVRLNMKYKSYSRGRGPGRLKGSAYKRHVWKQNQKGSFAGGRGGGGGGRGRGRGGGKPGMRTEDTCFKCGGKGHWASNCQGPMTSVPKKDIEKDWAMENVGEDEEFPTLEEAALAAAGIKPDKDAIARGEMKAPTVMPAVYEDPVPPPPIEPMFPLGEDGTVIDTPSSVMDALQDMGYSSFRPGQEHSIMRILSGLSTLVVLSTGAGKSLTYQLPAYIYSQRSPCITLVISPLVSLMDDQIFGLPKCLKGACLHSSMTKVQRAKVVKEIVAGNVNVLLVSPESIVGGGRSGGGCLSPLDQLPPIAFACIDEAHCVSEWSHNFRPSYLLLCRVLREHMGVKCLLGLTATATMRTANSVAEHLGIAGDKDAVVRGSSVPNNLKLSVSRDANRERAIVELLEGDRFRYLDSIIVYCIRREETEKVSSLLRTCLKADPVKETPSVLEEIAEDEELLFLPEENIEEKHFEDEEEEVEQNEKKKKGRKKKKPSVLEEISEDEELLFLPEENIEEKPFEDEEEEVEQIEKKKKGRKKKEEEPAEEEEEEKGKKKKGRKKKAAPKKKAASKKKSVSKKKTKTAQAKPPSNSVESYHAGKSPAQRRQVQNAFMCGKLRIVVATVAFGMGLDKADVRAVIHYNLPKSYESYVQEIGRAGRDGKPSHCHVFLDPEGSDLCELRRHTYANSIDRIVIKKLVNKVFLPCKCRQLHNLTSEGNEATSTNQNANSNTPETSSNDPSIAELESVLDPWDEEDGGETSTQKATKRVCPGHQVAFPTEATVQELDIKEESIATLLCYLELHTKRWVRNLPPLYATCNVICYGGPAELKATAKKCPPVAVAIAREQMRGKDHKHSNNVEFNAVEVASSMGWDIGPVKKELRQLQWRQVPGKGWMKSGTLVEFSELAMSIRAPGDMTDDDFDEVIEFLAERTKSQEQRELYQLQSVYTALHSCSCKHYGQCCDSLKEESSDKLKQLLREYFQSENTGMHNYEDVAWITPDSRLKPEAQEGQVRADVRQFIGLHHDRTFTGHAVARVMHGIASPCYPAQVWGRDRRFWRRHLDFDFSKLVKIATEEVLRMR